MRSTNGGWYSFSRHHVCPGVKDTSQHPHHMILTSRCEATTFGNISCPKRIATKMPFPRCTRIEVSYSVQTADEQTTQSKYPEQHTRHFNTHLQSSLSHPPCTR